MLLALSAAAMVASAAPVSLASPGFNYIEVTEKKGDFFADHFAQQLALYGLRVTTKSEMSAVIGLERQKQLLGCTDASSSCLAELAGALGANGIITGSLAKFRGGYTINIKVINATDATTVVVASTKVKDDEALVEWLSDTAKALAPKIIAGLQPKPESKPEVKPEPSAEVKPELKPETRPEQVAKPEPVEVSQSSGGVRTSVIVPAVAGGVLLIGGGVALFLAKSEKDKLEDPNSSYFDAADPAGSVKRANDAASRGQLFATLGYVGVGVGVAALATAAVLGFTGGEDKPQAALMVTPNGASFAVGGSF